MRESGEWGEGAARLLDPRERKDMGPLTPHLSTNHLSGNMSWVPILGLLLSHSLPFWFSLYLGGVESSRLLHFSGWFTCLVASGCVELIESNGMETGGYDKGEVGYFSSLFLRASLSARPLWRKTSCNSDLSSPK